VVILTRHQERQRQLAERRARVEKDKPRTAGGLHALCTDGNLGLADIQEALEDLGRSADGGSVVFRSVGLSGREISNMSALSAFVHLQRVDVSHNALESLLVLQHLPYLVYLDASHNRLTSVLDFRLPPPNAYALPAVSALREANLSCNNIAVIDDLSHHPNLSVLDLSDNHITHISGVESLRLLLCLNLDHNAITSVDGIPALSVKELGLGSNELGSLRGLSHCVHMEVLRAGSNGIDSLDGLESMKCLRVLDVSDNKLRSIEDVEAVCGHGNLSILQLEDNACSLVKCWRLKLLHRMCVAWCCVAITFHSHALIHVACRPWIESLDGIDVRCRCPSSFNAIVTRRAGACRGTRRLP
jgi:Leucine-rich repeat (LRR) protein